ncbi:MAG: AAA family ATPase [Pseudomonadota bacterium]
MSTPETTALAHRPQLDCIQARVAEALIGKQDRIRLALTALLAGGHVLLEDIPGVGKTTLAHALARVLGLTAHRVQFTSDMLPADLIGASIYQPQSGDFRFQPGPIFAEVVLADEINRASPKAQSALLEAMEERQVSVDGVSHPLPDPFFVIATQNPTEQQGVYPLPESQLDRFLLRLSLGYPERAAEKRMLGRGTTRPTADTLTPCLDADGLRRLREAVRGVHTSPAVLDHLLDLLHASRLPGVFVQGLSPRAGLGWLDAARAWALLHGRMHVEPEDLRQLAPHVTGHRLHFADPGLLQARMRPAEWLLERIAAPE